jgi:hypothetical protein
MESVLIKLNRRFMKLINISILSGILLTLLAGCQKDELPQLKVNESLNAQLAGSWKPVKHQMEYWKLNENIVQRGTDTMMVYENDSINGFWAFYNAVPCDTLNINADGTWTIYNRRAADANSGKDVKVIDTVKTVSGAKTTLLIKSRSWSVAEITSQGSSDYVKASPYLKLGIKNVQIVKETGKDDVVTNWWSFNKVFTVQMVEQNQLVVGYQAQMSVSYRPGALPTLPPQKINRFVTNTITFSK